MNKKKIAIIFFTLCAVLILLPLTAQAGTVYLDCYRSGNCGFCEALDLTTQIAKVVLTIGGIGSLAPGQRKQLSKFGMKALIGGTIASLISATIAGMIIG